MLTFLWEFFYDFKVSTKSPSLLSHYWKSYTFNLGNINQFFLYIYSHGYISIFLIICVRFQEYAYYDGEKARMIWNRILKVLPGHR